MKINEYIDFTLLKSDATQNEIKNLIDIAIQNNFYSICINPYFVKFAKNYITKNYNNSSLKIVSVIGFPLGCTPIKNKVAECMQCIEDGTDEIDMVANISAFKSKDYKYVLNDINSVCEKSKIVKVIIETSLLNDKEIIIMCEIFNKSKAKFIKTSTGFIGEGAKIEQVKLIKNNINKQKQIKASGGIRDLETAKAMINAGASRIGTSSADKWIK